MDEKFIDSVKRRVKSIEKEDDVFFVEDTKEQIQSMAQNQEYDEITDYQVAFMDLFT